MNPVLPAEMRRKKLLSHPTCKEGHNTGMPRVCILGAGPCGLGAAWRLKERGFKDFHLFEASGQPGGLASSYQDSEGFTWDVGGHVQFSHYEDFDRVMDAVLPDGWLTHQRESWVWVCGQFIPYPFQNNLWRLPDEIRNECMAGLENRTGENDFKHFGSWIDQSFGQGISRVFMRPYNFKVWAYPPEKLSHHWIGERVATVDLDRIKRNIQEKRDDVSWGPNAVFRFPKRGGTGAIWKSVSKSIGEENISFRHEVKEIDLDKKTIRFKNKKTETYDVILSSIPLVTLKRLTAFSGSLPLKSSKTHIVGIGLKGKTPAHLSTKCWMYFPESDCPFYRVTVFSNYSPENVPDPGNMWSLMCETSSSTQKYVDETKIIEQTIEGLRNTRLITPNDKIISKWYFKVNFGYPTPTLDRDRHIHSFWDFLSKHSIYSRGRFGAWKYEVSNQDHTFMQGFEWADWFLDGTPELTAFSPNSVNSKKQSVRVIS